MTAIGREEWVGAIESWVTEAMATAPRRLRRWLTWFYAKQADISPAGLRLVSGHGSEWRLPGERRCPDLLLVDQAGIIKVVIEVKAWAQLNGGWGYCPWAPDGYSGQLLCYSHGCWAKQDLSEAKFILVAPSARIAHLRADQQFALDNYGRAVDPASWQDVDLELLYLWLAAIAKRGGPCQSHAAVLVRLMGAWWWWEIPQGVPPVIA